MSATKALLEFFGIAAKDATPEELDELTKNTAAVLEAEPAKKAQEADPTEQAKDEDVPKGDDLGTKLDKILERIETIEKRVNGRGELEKDEKPSDETTIDAELTKLSGESGCGKGEDAVIEEETAVKAPDKETVSAILKVMRPIIAAIKDKDVKADITDALLESVRSGSVIGDIQKATAISAKKAADAAAKTNYERVCEGQQSAYNARNPHMKKEG